MMTMLHSVLSGGESAAGRRRSLLTLLAVLALIASVLIWAAPRSEAQSNQPPVAIGEITVPDNGDIADGGRDDNDDPDVVTSVAPDGETAVTLNGSKSFDADTGETATLTHKWEVTSENYAFLGLTPANADGAAPTGGATGDSPTFVAPTASVAARYGFTIEFQLTVTDAKGATDSITVSLNLNQPPVEDIAVSANATTPEDEREDADNDGTAEDFNEVHAGGNAVIDGPGQNGNGNDEWDIAENSGLTLDASGSSDVDGRVVSYTWTVYYQLPDGSGQLEIDSDGDVVTNGSGTDVFNDDTSADGTHQIAIPNITAAQSPYRVFYRLTVTDDKGGTSRGAIVRLLIHDQPATPKVNIAATDVVDDDDANDGSDDDSLDGSELNEALRVDATSTPPKTVNVGNLQAVRFPGLPNPKYVVAPGAVVTLDAGGSTDADDAAGTLTYEWSENVSAVEDVSTTDGIDEGTRATLRVDKDAEEGTTITVTAMVTDTSGLTGEGSVDFVVAKNTAPTATSGSRDDCETEAATGESPVCAGIRGATGGTTAGTEYITVDGKLGGDTDPATDDPTGTVTFRGIGFDPDQDADTLIYSWNEIDTAKRMPVDPDDAVLELKVDGATVSFDVPEVAESTTVVLTLSVLDRWGTLGNSTVVIVINPQNAAPSADAGSDQIVTPESFVRLNGAGSSDPDKGDEISTWSWALTGIATSPPVTVSKAVSDQVAKDLASFLPMPVDSNDDGTVNADDDGSTAYPDVLTGDDGRYPYFTAPKVADGISNIQLTFTLTVSDDGTDPAVGTDDLSDTDMVTITVSNQYYSGNITGPDFCTVHSMGGPQTFAYDSDDDGIADVCSLPNTRREAVATQRALETLVALNSTIDVTGKDAGNPDATPPADPEDVTSSATFADLVLGRDGVTAVEEVLGDNPVTTAIETEFATTVGVEAVSAIAGTCSSAPKDLGDPEAALAADACSTGRVSGPPPPVDPAKAAIFFSGIITGPDFCTNRSLGGIRTYALDTDDDGVADICSLSTTKREAVARQNALEMFKKHPQFNSAVAAACAALGSTTFEGDTQAAMDRDACAPKSPGSTPGQPLPTPTPASS